MMIKKRWYQIVVGMLVLIFLIGSILFSDLFKNSDFFSSLPFIEQYAQEHISNPPMDNDNWLNPNFSKYHRSQLPTWVGRLLHNLGIRTIPWTPDQFENLLQQVIKQQEEAGFTGRFVLAWKPRVEDNFIVWGAIHGAFHSLTRCLGDLHKKGIIDEQLRIIKPDHYFIFNGNAINQSAYNLETLTVILNLMLKNPGKVYYVRGEFEDKQRWQDLDMHFELMERAYLISDENIPLSNLLNRFFDTLPLAIYLQGKNKKGNISVVRFSGYDVNNQELDEQRYAQLLNKEYQEPTLLKLPKTSELAGHVSVGAAIHGINRELVYLPSQGLIETGKNKGFTEWNIFSAPTETYQRIHNFFNDAYTLIRVDEYVENWSITLFAQDVRTLQGFKPVFEYNLVTGLAVEEKKAIEKRHVVPLNFGSTMDLSRGARILGNHIKDALKAAFDYARDKNLVPGKLPSIILLDDEYRRERSLANVQQLLEEFKIDKLVFPLGTTTLQAYLDPMVTQNKLLVLFPASGATLFRNPDLKYIINLRPSFADEAYLGIRYLLTTERLTKFAFFYQDDEFGFSCLQGGKKALEEAHITEFIELRYERNDVNFSSQVKTCLEFHPDAICFFATSIAAEGFLRQLGTENLSDNYLFGISDLGEDRFKKFLRNKGLEMIITNVVPNPELSQIEMVKNFREFVKMYSQVAKDPSTLEVYIGCRFLFDILKRIPGEITKEKIIDLIEHTKKFTLEGLSFNFNPHTRELIDRIWIDPGTDADWIETPVDKDFSLHTPFKSNKTP